MRAGRLNCHPVLALVGLKPPGAEQLGGGTPLSFLSQTGRRPPWLGLRFTVFPVFLQIHVAHRDKVQAPSARRVPKALQTRRHTRMSLLRAAPGAAPLSVQLHCSMASNSTARTTAPSAMPKRADRPSRMTTLPHAVQCILSKVVLPHSSPKLLPHRSKLRHRQSVHPSVGPTALARRVGGGLV